VFKLYTLAPFYLFPPVKAQLIIPSALWYSFNHPGGYQVGVDWVGPLYPCPPCGTPESLIIVSDYLEKRNRKNV